MSRYVHLTLRVVLFVGAIVFFGSRAASAAGRRPIRPVRSNRSPSTQPHRWTTSCVATPLPREPADPATGGRRGGRRRPAGAGLGPARADRARGPPIPPRPHGRTTPAVVDADVDVVGPDGSDGLEAPDVPEIVVPGFPGTRGGRYRRRSST